MKSLMLGLLVIAPALASAQVVSQKTIRSPQGETLIERMVYLPDPDGKQTLVRQVLIPNQDGTFTYVPALQSADTLKFDQAFCQRVGGVASFASQRVLEKNTLFGASCMSSSSVTPKIGVMANGVWQERTKDESDQQEPNRKPATGAGAIKQADDFHAPGNLIILKAYAPKNFVVPARQNVVYQGYTEYTTNVAGYLSSRMQIGNGCGISQQDWVNANSRGTSNFIIACYASSPGTIMTSTTSCLQGVCTADRGEVTVI
ncbi:hypothetical protein [Dyella choica]|uniref:Uncharacterized protein n=1 Tax=Dyella choica TaxID=1927959 RepID=A0A432MC05_9GAMM|nr:hypothetical protein [Dyella choica]RUL79736.1 hypothetical protein EKH80_00605 [Dyella choica]